LFGESVHYSKYFLQRARDAGYSQKARIHEIEDLKGPKNIALQRGKQINCPITNQTWGGCLRLNQNLVEEVNNAGTLGHSPRGL
jgi:hypothetical protein